MTSRRKPSGGKTRSHRKSRRHEKEGEFSSTKLGEAERRNRRNTRGNTEKRYINKEKKVNLSMGEKTENVEIEEVLENPANPDYPRREIITKGTIVKTEKGKAKITSRPGQTGTLNAVIIEE